MKVKVFYKNAAVVTSSKYCASVGRDILKKGGSCVDAAIACLLCEGIFSLHNSGLGGGHMMTIYKRDENKAYVLDARECAPLAAHKYMFKDEPPGTSVRGLRAAAVPGELMGFWEAHKKFGILPWDELFQPAIQFAFEGIPISQRLSKSLATHEMKILESPSIREILAPEGHVQKEGELIKLPALGHTLVTLSSKGAPELYRGSLTQPFVSDIQKYGGIITQQDMANYKTRWCEAVSCNYKNLIVHTVPCPGSGPVLCFIIHLMNKFLQDFDKIEWRKILVEAMKHGYALRSCLGDPRFTNVTSHMEKLKDNRFLSKVEKKIQRVLDENKTKNDVHWYGGKFFPPDNKGTVSTAVLACNGDAVAATSTINMLFGCLGASPQTGIILNSQMDDFSFPGVVNSFMVSPSKANLVEPGKRPLSSMCPSVITDNHGSVKLTIASAGGTHITSSVAQVILNYLWLGHSLECSVDLPRLHHQLLPMAIKHETTYPEIAVEVLKEMGHIMKPIKAHSAVVAIGRDKQGISAKFDPRRCGSAEGY